jgi:plastocyanin
VRGGAVSLATACVGLVVLVLLAASCDRVAPGSDDGPRIIELAHDTIRLEAGVRLVEVRVARGASGEFEPDPVQAGSGDYVRFTADDRGGHAIVFAGALLQPDAREFLQRTGQLRSPPLITAGASWVITLDGAPAGEYPFHCTTHDAAGTLTVAPR